MTNPALQETIIRTMKDAPERLRNICDNKVLEAFFEKGNYLIMRIVPSGDTRFYLESGKRITSIMDFLKPLQKQGMYFDGYGVNAGKKSKIKPPPPVPEVVSTMTEEVCTLFGKELMTDFYAEGFYLTIKGVSRKRKPSNGICQTAGASTAKTTSYALWSRSCGLRLRKSSTIS